MATEEGFLCRVPNAKIKTSSNNYMFQNNLVFGNTEGGKSVLVWRMAS